MEAFIVPLRTNFYWDCKADRFWLLHGLSSLSTDEEAGSGMKHLEKVVCGEPNKSRLMVLYSFPLSNLLWSFFNCPHLPSAASLAC